MSTTVVNLPLPGGLAPSAPPEIEGVIVEGFDSPKGFNNAVKAEKVQVQYNQITSVQLLALKETPIQLFPTNPTVAGPGAGLSYAVKSVSLRLNWTTGGTAYTLNAGTLKVFLGSPLTTGTAVTADLSAILTQTAVSDIVGQPTLTTGVVTQAAAENVALWLGNTGAADYTLGTSTLDVVVEFTVLQM